MWAISTAVVSMTLTAAAMKIAVLPCQLDEKAKAEIPALVNEYVLTAVSEQGFNTVGAEDIEALLGFERQKDLLGCDDASCFAQIGGALGVDRLVHVKIAVAGNKWATTAKLINTADVKVEARATRMVEGDASAVLEDIPNLIRKLFGDPAVADPATTPEVARQAPAPTTTDDRPSRYEVGAVFNLGLTSVDKYPGDDAFPTLTDRELTDSYWTWGLFTRWREGSVGSVHFLLEGEVAGSTVEVLGPGQGGTENIAYLHAMQLVRLTTYENLERWAGASTDRVAFELGAGGYVRFPGPGDAGFVGRLTAQVAWFQIGPTITVSSVFGLQVGLDAGLHFGLF